MDFPVAEPVADLSAGPVADLSVVVAAAVAAAVVAVAGETMSFAVDWVSNPEDVRFAQILPAVVPEVDLSVVAAASEADSSAVAVVVAG